MTWDVSFDLGGDFPQAVVWFRSRLPITDAEFAELDARAQAKAFKVAGVAQLDVATEVWDALDEAISEGTDLVTFADAVGGTLAEAWGGEDAPALERIFRTNVQTAYGAGRQIQQADPAVREARPYSRFVAVNDSRTSEICSNLDGTTLQADDPFWDSHQPPLHHNCRSTVITLDEEQAAEFGIDDEAPDVDAAEGFGAPLKEWVPDLSDAPAPLVAQYRAKANR
jgi:SPP1 gp7 family putative phage head morphogenesis protein